MLNACFKNTPNARGLQPSHEEITEPLKGVSFETRAFNALLKNKGKLGIKQLFRCRASRMDGYLITTQRKIILLEMKERLGWGSVQAAGFQFLAGRQLLRLQADRGIVVFDRISKEWSQIKPNGGWGQLALHSQELSPHIEIGALQVLESGHIRTQPPRRARQGG